jgi:alpha-tubulin suppressor-like RCC1 family protein
VTTGGAAYCWGANNLGQLATGTTKSSVIPVQVMQGPAATSVAHR